MVLPVNSHDKFSSTQAPTNKAVLKSQDPKAESVENPRIDPEKLNRFLEIKDLSVQKPKVEKWSMWDDDACSD